MAKLEDNFKEIEEIIKKLESNETPLDDSFVLYEQGMKLVKECNDELDKVEKKLIVLGEENNG